MILYASFHKLAFRWYLESSIQLHTGHSTTNTPVPAMALNKAFETSTSLREGGLHFLLYTIRVILYDVWNHQKTFPVVFTRVNSFTLHEGATLSVDASFAIWMIGYS